MKAVEREFGEHPHHDDQHAGKSYAKANNI
jgi:hypothetical protein